MSGKLKLLVVVTLMVAVLPSCASVKPWQKGKLARPEMSLGGHALEGKISDHIHFAKEASSGGTGSAGGGCGCN